MKCGNIGADTMDIWQLKRENPATGVEKQKMIIQFPDVKGEKAQEKLKEIQQKTQELSQTTTELLDLLTEYSEMSGSDELEKLCIQMMKSIIS